MESHKKQRPSVKHSDKITSKLNLHYSDVTRTGTVALHDCSSAVLEPFHLIPLLPPVQEAV
jgi:hypothetical protein